MHDVRLLFFSFKFLYGVVYDVGKIGFRLFNELNVMYIVAFVGGKVDICGVLFASLFTIEFPKHS